MEDGLPKVSNVGELKAKLGRKTNVCLPVSLVEAMCARCVARHRIVSW